MRSAIILCLASEAPVAAPVKPYRFAKATFCVFAATERPTRGGEGESSLVVGEVAAWKGTSRFA